MRGLMQSYEILELLCILDSTFRAQELHVAILCYYAVADQESGSLYTELFRYEYMIL